MFKGFFRIDKSYWLLVPMILQATIPWLQFRIRIWYVFAFVLAWLACNFGQIVASLSSRASTAARWFILWYLLFNTIGYIYALFGHGDYMGWGRVSIFANQIVFFIAVHCTLEKRKFRELRFMAFLAMFGLLVAGLMGLRGVNVEGLEGARNLVGGAIREYGSKGFDQQLSAFEFGLGDYRFVYMCSWLFPLFLMTMSLSHGKIVKAVMVVLAISMIVSIKTGGLGTATMVVVISFCMYCLWRVSRSSRVSLKIAGWILIVMFFIYATIPSVFSFLSAPIKAIANTMSEGSVKERFSLVAESFSGHTYDNYAYYRAQLQLASIKGFLNKPIFGNGQCVDDLFGGRSDIIGGHSMILDHLAYYGLVGLIPLLLMVISFGKYYAWMSHAYFGKKWLSLSTIFIILFVFSSLANPTFGIPHMMFVILPGLGYIIAASNKNPIIMGGQPGRWSVIGCPPVC